MSRLFTFGCSFTEYSWPTWATIIEIDLGIPTQNWAYSGIGNVGIFNRLVECDLKNSFNSNDLILILWSHWYREDRFIQGTWQAHGNIFTNPFYDKRFINNYWSLGNDLIKNSNAIIAANKLYKINFQGHIIPPAEFEGDVKDFSLKDQEILNFYKDKIPQDNIFPMSKSAYDWAIKDSHPDILNHMHYVEHVIYPKLGFNLKPATKDFFNSLHDKILKILRPSLNKNRILHLVSEELKKEYNIDYRNARPGF